MNKKTIKKIKLEVSRTKLKLKFNILVFYFERSIGNKISRSTLHYSFEFTYRTISHISIIISVSRSLFLSNSNLYRNTFNSVQELFEFFSKIFCHKYETSYAVRAIYYRISSLLGYLFSKGLVSAQEIEECLEKTLCIAENNNFKVASQPIFSGLTPYMIRSITGPSNFTIVTKIKHFISITLFYDSKILLNIKRKTISITPKAYIDYTLKEFVREFFKKKNSHALYIGISREEFYTILNEYRLLGII